MNGPVPSAPLAPKPSTGFFRRSMKATVFLGALGALFAAVYVGYGAAGRYLLFLAWMLANLLLWAAGLREALGKRRTFPLITFGTAKFLWLAALYGLCAWAGIRGVANFLSFLLGLNTPFLVMFLKALGAAVTQGWDSTNENRKTSKETKEADSSLD